METTTTALNKSQRQKLEWAGQLLDVLDVVDEDTYQPNNESDDESNSYNESNSYSKS